jgi:hypothetical protein
MVQVWRGFGSLNVKPGGAANGPAGCSRQKMADCLEFTPRKGDRGMQRILAVIVMAGSLGFLAGCGESAADKAARETKEAAEKQAMIKANEEEQQRIKSINEQENAKAAAKGEEASDEGKKSDDDSEKSKDE